MQVDSDAITFSMGRTWVVKILFHLVLLFGAFIVAYELRRGLPIHWWFTHPDAVRVLRWALLYAFIGGAVEAIFQTERSAWRYASAHEAIALARNVLVTMAIFVLALFISDRGLQLPRSAVAIAGLLSLLSLVGLRLAWRVRHDQTLMHNLLPTWWGRRTSRKTPMIVFGSMADADRNLHSILGDEGTPYEPIGVLTPHLAEVGLRVRGVPFTGTLDDWSPAEAGLIGRDVRPHALLFLEPPAKIGLSANHIGELRKAGHHLLRPQSLTELGVGAAMLKEIPLEEFLPRKPISLDATPVRALVAGKRVLVTGAGGSIGSEIVRQLTALRCAHLTLIDHSEFLLFEIDRELGNFESGNTRRAFLASIRDEARLEEIFRMERPEIVFHAAALKHVELVENNPSEGVLTNLGGTWNVMRAAVANDVEQFVLISTDKAVAPTNVMGATKRLAEGLLELFPGSATRLSAVRFGNVLGSAGSVVPIFRDQIAKGGPVTVTHPEVDRYFMTIPEAVQLVLHSAAINAAREGKGLCKYLLEMGEPVKIVDLARQMIQLSGLTPDVDIMIEYSGLKAGEKMSEALLTDEERGAPCAEGIMEVVSSSDGRPITKADIKKLVGEATNGDQNGDLRKLVMQLANAIR